MLLFGKDYRHKSKHFQGFLTRGQVERLANELVMVIFGDMEHPKTEIKPINNWEGFYIHARTTTSDLRLRLKKDERECSNLYVRISGNGDFKYSGILDIANFTHGEIAD